MLEIFNRPPKYNSIFYPTEAHHENTFVLEIFHVQNILLTVQEGPFLQPARYVPLLEENRNY